MLNWLVYKWGKRFDSNENKFLGLDGDNAYGEHRNWTARKVAIERSSLPIANIDSQNINAAVSPQSENSAIHKIISLPMPISLLAQKIQQTNSSTKDTVYNTDSDFNSKDEDIQLPTTPINGTTDQNNTTIDFAGKYASAPLLLNKHVHFQKYIPASTKGSFDQQFQAFMREIDNHRSHV